MNIRYPNSAFGDAAVLLDIGKDRLMFDAGMLPDTSLVTKIIHVLISHTHLDHFGGFDAIIRCNWDTGAAVHVYGPEHIAKQVRARIDSYTWNFETETPLTFHLHEIIGDSSHNYKEAIGYGSRRLTSGDRTFCYQDFTIDTLQLHHRIPSIGYSVQLPGSYRFEPARLEGSGLQPGPWIDELKKLFTDNEAGLITIGEQQYGSDELKHLLTPQTGKKVVYMVDFRPSGDYETIVDFVAGADYFLCEGFFSDSECEQAERTKHMTVSQTATLARDAGVSDLVLVHCSKRYQESSESLLYEATEIFSNTYYSKL